MATNPPALAPPSPDLLATFMCAFMVELRLTRLIASTDTHTITVSEPSMWEGSPKIEPPRYGLNVEIREHEL